MSDEVPFTAINSRFLQVFKENPDARELVFYGGSGVEQVDQRRTDPPEAVPRHEAAPRSACSSPGNGCPR